MIVVLNPSLTESWGMKNIKELSRYAEAKETILLHMELGALIRDSDRASFDRKYKAIRKSVRKESIIVDATDLYKRSLKRLADEESGYAEEVKKIDDAVKKAVPVPMPTVLPPPWRSNEYPRSTRDMVIDGAGRYRR